MNKIFIIGRLTAEPENRTTPNGISVTTLRVAVNRRMNRDQADFFNVVTWRGLADNCARYLVKGQQVAVEGELQTRSYEAKDGTTRTVVEIQADNVEFLAKPGESRGSGASAPKPKPQPMPSDEGDIFASEMSGVLVEDEELPF